ncbi:MAG: hypothetical protein K6G15_00995 [Desulfovibrio sp.]|nr:hypothetical protein [Desulfovibrio sp.]
MEAWEAAELQILKAKNDMFIETQKGTIELTKMILRGTFIINGAAAAAVLAARDPALFVAMFCFSWGALASVCATGITYLVQGMVSATWAITLCKYPFRQTECTQEELDGVQMSRWNKRWGNKVRFVAIGFVVTSISLFAIGLCFALSTLS